MELIESVKEFLPTPWSRRVVSVTATLVGLIVLLPQWWTSVVGQDPIEQPALLVRLSLLSTILFLGSSIALCLVVMEYRAQTKKLKETQTALGECVRQNIAHFNEITHKTPTPTIPPSASPPPRGLLG